MKPGHGITLLHVCGVIALEGLSATWAHCCLLHGLCTGSGRKEGLRGLNPVWHSTARLPGLCEFVAAGGLESSLAQAVDLLPDGNFMALGG